jgi:DNA repair protein RadC
MTRPQLRRTQLRDATGGAQEQGPAEALDKGPAKAPYKGHRDRVRARLLTAGPEALADYELLELLLFYSVERVDVKPLAKALLLEFGSLGAILAASREQLEKHDKVGERTTVHFKAIREAARRLVKEAVVDRPVVSSWSQLLDYCRVAMADEQTERFRILFLDRKNRIIRDEVQQTGTVDHTPLYPREVIKRTLELGASSLILVHNHPSGDPTPSPADVAMTRELSEIGAKLGITLYDHVVVAKSGCRSFKAMGLL